MALMTIHDPVAVAQRYFDAVSQGDMETVAAVLDPEVVWHQPGNNRFSGTHIGVASIAQLIGGMMEISEGTFTVTVTGTMMNNDDVVAVPVRFQGKRADATMDMAGIDLVTVTNGKITAIMLFSEDQSSEDQFWGTP